MSERDKWEKILADEGMEEISLFDNTGKNATCRFVSATAFEEGEESEHGNGLEYWNAIHHDGFQLLSWDLDSAKFYRKLSVDVESLPPGWDRTEVAFLRLWADIGVMTEAARILSIDDKRAKQIVKKFKEWVSNAN